jgi:glutamyl-tRNA synthetase
MSHIVTRFAPSPTGSMHIGNLRTALYAYAMSRHSEGKFILRIEDTDKKREVEGGVDSIKRILNTFNITWDEYFIQSERVAKGYYAKAAEKLISDGNAFYCQCEAKNAKDNGYSEELRDPCRDKGFTTGAIKLKVPENEVISFFDFVIDKKITWHSSKVQDATLLKSDGFPTYHLAVVVDDADMGITHVMRGHDWLPSTPIHLLVYKYLELEAPQIGHPTDILDPEGGKLSKRKGSVSVDGMIAEGYLPEAIFNFIILLGWAPKDNRELFTLKEFIEAFDPSGFQKSNPVFNREKLDWFNGHYIRQKSDEELVDLLSPFLPLDRELMKQIVPLVKERIQKLSEIKDLAAFFEEKPEVDTSLFTEKYKVHLNKATKCLESSEWSVESLTNCFIETIKSEGFKTGEFFMDLRIAMSGKRFTPPITECVVLLGRDEALARIQPFT